MPNLDLFNILDYQGAVPRLDTEQLQSFRDRLKQEPNDFESRLHLAAHYKFHKQRGTKSYRSAYAKHLAWIIDNFAHQLANAGAFSYDWNDEHFVKLKERWLAAFERFPSNVILLENAAHFFTLFDWQTSERMFLEASQLEPFNAEWQRCLCFLYLLKASDPDSAADCLSLQMAIERLKAALELQKRDWRESYLEFYIGMEISHLVSRLIFFKMFDQIEYFTDHLIDLVNPNYTNLEGKKRPDRPWAANLAHSIIGHKALVKGDLDQAKRCFVKLQEYPESTYNDALCALAEGLAEAGELDMVITYYEKQCESLCCRLAQPDLNPFQRSRLETHLKSKIQAIQHLSRQRKK